MERFQEAVGLVAQGRRLLTQLAHSAHDLLGGAIGDACRFADRAARRGNTSVIQSLMTRYYLYVNGVQTEVRGAAPG